MSPPPVTAPTAQTSSITPPNSDSTLHISLTPLETSYLIFLTSSTSASGSNTTDQTDPSRTPSSTLQDSTATNGTGVSSLADTEQFQTTSSLASTDVLAGRANPTSALGSFVYALPNRFSPTEPLTSVLVSVPSSIELATRLARILVRRLTGLGIGKPVYLACSIVFDGYDDEIDAQVSIVRGVVEEVLRLAQHGGSTSKLVNGIKT